jgi:hypothetical protein
MMNIFQLAAAAIADKALVNKRVTDEEKKRRLAICEACKFFDAESRRCKVCKCFMDVKASAEINLNPMKGRYEVTHCPKGFWDDKDVANHYRELDGIMPIS